MSCRAFGWEKKADSDATQAANEKKKGLEGLR